MAGVNRGKSPSGNVSPRDKRDRAAETRAAQKKAPDGKLIPPGPEDGRDEPAAESLPSKVNVPARQGERFW